MELPEFIKLKPTGDIVWLACSDGRASVPDLAGANLHEIRMPGGLLAPELGIAGTLLDRITDLVNNIIAMVQIKKAGMVVIALHDHCAAQKDLLGLSDEEVDERAHSLELALKGSGVTADIHIIHKQHCEQGVHLGWETKKRPTLRAA